MSDVKRYYVSPRTIALFLRADPSGEVPAGFVGLTLLSDYDALAQRCCNLEAVQQAGLERSGRIKSSAGALGWTAEREDGPLDFLIAQAQRCPELEAERERIRESYVPHGDLLRQTSNLRAEVEALRQIISECARAAGATVSEECSLEFMAGLPGEIAVIIERLEKSLAGMCDETEKLMVACEAVQAEHQAAELKSLQWLTEVRFACGDNGQRMLPELFEHLKALYTDADRYRCFRRMELPNGLGVYLDELDTALDNEILEEVMASLP
jgi:hypothetical protein